MVRRTAPNLFVYANDRSTMATALVPCFASSIRDHRVFPRTFVPRWPVKNYTGSRGLFHRGRSFFG